MKTRNNNYLSLAVSAATLSLVLTGCGAGDNATEEAQASNGGESSGSFLEQFESSVPLDEDFNPDAHFSYASAYAPSTFDPLNSASGLDQPYLTPIYDRLMYRTPEGSLEPMLAEDYETDGDTLTLKLRPGLTFSDGEPFNAEAVKINLERYMTDESKIRADVAHIEEITVVDELTVELETTGAGAALAGLGERGGMMVSPAAIEEGNVETQPVGIGPYEATKVTPAQSVSLEKTEDYWDPSVQRVATMDVVAMPEAQTRINALSSGEVHAAEIDVSNAVNIQTDAFHMIAGQSPTVYSFAVNTSEPAFEDVRVREALNLAIDREAIAQGLFDGACVPQVQPWPESSFAYNPDIGDGLDRMQYDPERAKELLEEAGFEDKPGGFDAVYTNTATSAQLAEVLQGQFENVGITINPTVAPSGGLTDAFGISQTAPTTATGHTGGPDPDALMGRFFSTDAIYNPGPWETERFTELAAEGASAVEPEDRAPAYHEMAEAFIEEPPHVVSICAASLIRGYDDSVSNMTAGGSYQDLRGVAVSE